MNAVPTSPGPVVTLPMALADKLFACYYGGGPRHPGAPNQSAPTVPAATPPVSDDQERAATERLREAILASRQRRMIPRGQAPGATPTVFPDTMTPDPPEPSP